MARRKEDVEVLKSIIGHITSTQKMVPPGYSSIVKSLDGTKNIVRFELSRLLVDIELGE